MPRRPAKKVNVPEPEPMEVEQVRKPKAATKRKAPSASPADPVPPVTKSARTARSKTPFQVNAEENNNHATEAEGPKRKGVKRTESIKAKKVLQPFATEVLGKLFTFGSNTCGELGYEADQRKFPFAVPTLNNTKIKAVACGGMHTLALDEKGQVWSFGCNDDMALGRVTNEEEDGFEPGVVDLPKAKMIIQVSAGDSHSAALTEDGNVYLWGCFKNENGNFGLVPNDNGPICKVQPQLISSDIPSKVVKIVSGGHHIAMLTEDRYLYTCGVDDQGQLGRKPPAPIRITRSMNPDTMGSPVSKNDKGHLLRPGVVRIGRNSKIDDVWAGEFSTYCLVNNNIYVFGLNNYCQLGIPLKIKKDNSGNEEITNSIIDIPTKNTNFQGKIWTQIAAGQHHTIALDGEGKVYTLGRCSDARLGHGQEDKGREYLNGPTLVLGLQDKKCVLVAAGGSTSYAVTEEGHLYSWGFGENYQLATGDDEDRDEPFKCMGGRSKGEYKEIDGRVISVQAGGQHVALTIYKQEQVNGTAEAMET